MKKLIVILCYLLIAFFVVGQIAPEKVITEKKHKVWSVAYSDDGKMLASGGDDGSVIIYNTQNYTEVIRFEGLKDVPVSVCFSHDGKKVAAAGKDKRITVWSLESKLKLFEFKGHKDYVIDVEFSPNDKILASASYDRTLKLWNTSTGELMSTLEGHGKQINSLNFSPNGERLISGSGDKTIKIWDVKKSSELLTIPAHSDWVRCVKYSPDASLIASGGNDRKIHIWDAYSGKLLNTFLGHKNWVMSLDFSPDGSYLLSGGQDNLIILTNLRSGKMEFQSEKQSEKILAIAFNPNGETFAFAALFDVDLQVWSTRSLNIKPIDQKIAQKSSLESGMVPMIDWLSPSSNVTSNEASLVIKANIKSESSLRKIELYVNNVLFSSKDRGELMLEVADNNITLYEELVILNEGENTVQVKAKNIAGEAQSSTIVINYSAIPVELLSWIQPGVPELETSTSIFEAKAHINKAGMPQEVSVLLNGVPVQKHSIDAAGGDIAQNIELVAGKNVLLFQVKTALYTKETESRIINYTPPLKPVIAWINPVNDTSSFISAINLKANISSKVSIDKVEIQVNGLAVYTKRFLEENTFVIDKNIQVSSGKNTIRIVAANSTGETLSIPKVIEYNVPEKTNISWITPSLNLDVFSPSFELRACIQSKTKVSKVVVYNNEQVIHSEDEPTPSENGECTIQLIKTMVLSQGENTFRIEAENLAGITHSEMRKVNYTIPQLAKVIWTQPNASQITSTDKNINLKACIRSNTPILGIDLIANNQIISKELSQQNVKGECTFDFEQLISLNTGNNTVMVKVKNIAGEAISQPLFIDHRSANPYKFALIIGNEDYSSYQTGIGSESNVDFALNDAQEFKDLCMGKLGIKEEKIVYLENARQMEMVRAVNKLNLLIKASDGKAEVYVFYAGHGFPEEKTKEPFLIPVDVSGSDLAFGGGIKVTQFYELLTEHPAQRITVFLDACFSGGARNQGLVAARGVKIVPKETKKAVKNNLIVFAASSGNETSLPYKDKKHGMFTYYLLKKINETNGAVSYRELSDYLKYEVNVNSLLINNKEQQPQTNVSEEVGKEWEIWKFND